MADKWSSTAVPICTESEGVELLKRTKMESNEVPSQWRGDSKQKREKMAGNGVSSQHKVNADNANWTRTSNAMATAQETSGRGWANKKRRLTRSIIPTGKCCRGCT